MIDHPQDPARHRGPLQRKSLKREVFDVLQGRVIAGAYSPGIWLRQSEIADELAVSLTPVREALDQLVAEGLAQRVPYRGVRVPTFSDDEIADAYVARLIIEAPAAGMAAHNISSSRAASLLALVEQTKSLTKPADMARYRRLNWRIHRSIADATGNRLLARVHSIALNRFPDWMLYEGLLQKPDELCRVLQREHQEHAALADAITSSRPAEAVDAAFRHLRGVRQDIVSSLGVPEELLVRRESQVCSDA